MIKRKLLTVVLFTTFNSFSYAGDEVADAMKLSPNINNGEKIYGICATCHEKNGWGKVDGSFPVIAGQHRSVIIKQLIDIRSRNRENPTMYPFSGDDVIGGAQGLADISAYVSQLPKTLVIGKGTDFKSSQLKMGETLYKEKCIACHGEKGEGNAEGFFPRIQGQHYAYLLRQLQWIRDGRRKNVNPVMLALTKDLDDQTLSIIANYISHIKLDK